ncbi:MAG: Fe-S protein [Comamonadaceae bacterium]|nr:Fe-S protein [Comamonadaceae bacterium]
MAGIHITDIEAAINHWRERLPTSEGMSLAPTLRALAEVYALMVYQHRSETEESGLPPAAHEAWLAWFQTTPDTPCIAICSTSQGDEVCKGCGRTFDEVQRWTEMTAGEKRASWRRITLEASSWRFNRYAERGR